MIRNLTPDFKSTTAQQLAGLPVLLLRRAGGLMLVLLLLLAGRARAQAPGWSQVVAPTQTSTSTSNIRGSAVDASGNVIVVGSISGSVVFGSTTLTTSSTQSNFFVAKWNPTTATWLWATQGTSTHTDIAFSVAVQGTSIYVGGYFNTDLAIGSSTLTAAGGGTTYDMFLAKYTDNGGSVTKNWAVGAGGTSGTERLNGLAVSGTSVYITGYFTGAATIAGTALTGTGTNDMFVAKYTDATTTATGNWAVASSGAASKICQGLAIAASGSDMYVTGYYTTSATIAGTALTATSGNDMFVAKYTDATTTATGRWAVSGGGNSGTAPDQGNSIAVSGTSVYVTGLFTAANATIAGSALTGATSSSAMFLAKYTDATTTATGNWAVASSGGNVTSGLDLVLSGTSLYVTGTYTTSATIAGTALAAAGSVDVFVAKYTDATTTATGNWATDGGGTGTDTGYTIALGSTSLFAGGTVAPPATFDTYTVGTTGPTQQAVLGRLTLTAPVNAAPTDLALSNSSVAENQPVSTTVGTFSSTDPNAGDTFTYTFASGGTDNGSFNISGSTLTTNGVFNYEVKNSYSIKIRSTDQGSLFFEKTLTVSVTNVAEVPTVTSFMPPSGPVGTSVTINGTHFSDAGAATVKFNGTTATTVTVNSNSQITASVPIGATTGTISVTNSDGPGTSSASFTVTVPPSVTSVAVPASATYGISQNLDFSVSFNQAVTVNTGGGTPTLALTVGSTARTASYVSGSGTSTLVFRYTVPTGDLDTNGVALGSSIALNGGTIRNASGLDTSLTLNGVASTTSVLVDGVAPVPTISSSVGTSGSSTSTAPIPFSVSFSETVSGFVIGDITVTNGTKSALAGSGPYTFTVTPTAPGAVTVNIAAGVATDAGSNGNTAASPFTITYAPAPTITALSPAAELPGMPVVITGTGFTAASTVSFGGVAAASVTYTSATSLTATVPAGAAVGSSAVVVSTAGTPSTSSPAFSVLKVYDAVASCLTTTSYTATGDGAWHYLLAPNGQVVAALQDTRAALGTVSVEFLITGSASAVRQDAKAHKYLDRNWHLVATNPTFTGSSLNVRFYGLTSEFTRLVAADASVSYATLKATQYSGANEDCQLGNNAAAGQHRTLALSASTPGNGVAWFVAQAAVADHFSEFYLTGSTAPLPVELVTFTAEASDNGHAVHLAWATASEKNSARFEVERSLDGQQFNHIGEVAGQGTKASPTDYAYLDNQVPKPLSPPVPLYYRLRQVDMDGTASYSPVRAVTLGSKELLTLYPNPAHGAVTVGGIAAGMQVEVFDALGRVVAQATAEANGSAQLALPTGLAAGLYVVRAGSKALRLTVE